MLLTWKKSMSNIGQHRNRLAKAINCSKLAANAPESRQRDDTNGLYVADIWTDQYVVEANVMTSKH